MKQNRSRRHTLRKPDALDLADQVLTICRRIETLAALLTSYGASRSNSPAIEPEVIARAGSIIESDAQALAALLINPQTASRARNPGARKHAGSGLDSLV